MSYTEKSIMDDGNPFFTCMIRQTITGISMGWIVAGSIIFISSSAVFNPSSLILFGNRLLNSCCVKPCESNLVHVTSLFI